VKEKSGEGWVDYGWVKPGDEKESMKTSFVKKCGKFLVGSGIWK
jgi:signal transduction histidine kinase